MAAHMVMMLATPNEEATVEVPRSRIGPDVPLNGSP